MIYPNIGFNIIVGEDLIYTDSGYYVLRLMGGWILLIPVYFLLYSFMKTNFGNRYFSSLNSVSSNAGI